MDDIRADVMRDIINEMFDHFQTILIEQGKEIANLKRENEHLKLRLDGIENSYKSYYIPTIFPNIPKPRGPMYDTTKRL